MKMNENMAISEGIKEMVNQAAIQTATAVMMAFGDTNTRPQTTPTVSHKELQRQGHGGPVLEKPLFNWDAQDRYNELINFEMEVTDILEMRTYELTGAEKVPVIKDWLGQEDLQLIKTFTHDEKEKCRTAKGLLLVFSNQFKLQYKNHIISLQYHKLHRKINESDQEWIGRL